MPIRENLTSVFLITFFIIIILFCEFFICFSYFVG